MTPSSSSRSTARLARKPLSRHAFQTAGPFCGVVAAGWPALVFLWCCLQLPLPPGVPEEPPETPSAAQILRASLWI